MKNLKRMCLTVLGLLCAVNALHAGIVSVTIDNFEACRQLGAGSIYIFDESMDFTAAPGESALSITNGTAAIIIPAGVRVSLAGGAADGVRGGGAGIEVASNATLYVYGDGELVCTGGAAAAGTSGADGTAGSVEVTEATSIFDSSKVVCLGGTGGAGGNGGGGAGAGLGGRGGNGGTGAPETAAEAAFGGVAEGDDGKSGTSGSDGGGCGAYFVYGPKTFRGGAVTATSRKDGATGAATCAEVNSIFYAAFGGGGGGQGGDGGCGADIGGGGFGGFGGGAGGSGICQIGNFRADALSERNPARGERGGAGSNGETGIAGMRLDPTGGTVNGESVWKGQGDGWLYDALENEVVIQENGPYDVRGDVSVNGNGHYRVTFPGSPVVLWLENGNYTFRLSTVEGGHVVEHYYSAVVNDAEVVSSEVKPVVVGVRVNGKGVGSLMGDGWMYAPDSKILTLDGSVPYVLSGVDGFGNVKVTVRGKDAKVTLSDLRLSGGSGADCFRVEDGASVKLGIEGTNMLQGASVGDAGIRLAGVARMTIDSCGEGAMLIAQGGDSAPGIRVEREAALSVDGGLLCVGGGTNSAASIGGTEAGVGSLAITGGTIVPLDGTPETNIACIAVIAGGSIWPDFASVPTNALGQPLYRVTVECGKWEKENGKRAVEVEGLEEYGTRDLYAIDGEVHFWLPDGTYEFSVDGDDYFVMVEGGPTRAVRGRIAQVDYLEWNGAEMEGDTAVARMLTGDMTELNSDFWYAVTGAVTTSMLTVSGTANLILADGAKLTVTHTLLVTEGNALNIYAQSEGDQMGALVATGAQGCAGIGGGQWSNGGTISVHGGKVTATGGEYGAGIGGGNHASGGTFTICGGEVMAKGGCLAAGIGSGCGDTGYGICGKITIDGGRVTAIGGEYGAGIGTGNKGSSSLDSNITINGGTVVATGGTAAAGIGGGNQVDGGTITVNGGVVTATGGQENETGGAGIGAGRRVDAGGNGGVITITGGTIQATGKGIAADIGDGSSGSGGTVTITGGNVLATRASIRGAPTNGVGQAVYRVTVVIGKLGIGNGEQGMEVEGLEGYGLKDVHAIDGKVYFYLPDGDYSFNVNGRRYSATVNGEATEATGDLRMTYLRRNGTAMVQDEAVNPVVLSDSAKTIGSADGVWYVVTGAVTTADLAVNGTANLILADGAKLTATGGIHVKTGNTLNIYAQSEGDAMGVLDAQGGVKAAGIGGQNFDSCGQVVINGGSISAKGGRYAAGIGGGRSGSGGKVTINGGNVNAVGGSLSAGIGGAGDDPDAITPSGSGSAGEVTVNGGRVTATGGTAAAGIGGACEGRGGTVTVFGGTIVAKGGTYAADIGSGDDGSFGMVTINGGNVVAKQPKIDGAPQNSAKQRLYCVTLTCEGSGGLLRLEGLEGYGAHDIYAVDGKVCLYLPNGTYAFSVNGVGYEAVVEGGATNAWKSASSNATALPDSVKRMVASIDLAALMTAPVAGTANAAQPSLAHSCQVSILSVEEGGIDLTVRGGVPGCAYTLCAASGLDALTSSAPEVRTPSDSGTAAVTEYGPEVCGADGTVTFKNVCRPGEKQGFFTIRTR